MPRNLLALRRRDDHINPHPRKARTSRPQNRRQAQQQEQQEQQPQLQQQHNRHQPKPKAAAKHTDGENGHHDDDDDDEDNLSQEFEVDNLGSDDDDHAQLRSKRSKKAAATEGNDDEEEEHDDRNDDGDEDQGISQLLQRMAPSTEAKLEPADLATHARAPAEEEDWQTVGPDGKARPADPDAGDAAPVPGVFFGAVAVDELDDNEKITGSGLRTTKELFAPPTREEMAQLRETQQLFRSNLFRMQMEEMLPNIRLKASKRDAIGDSLHKLKACLEALPAQPRRRVSLKDYPTTAVPPVAVAPHNAEDLSFAFEPPASIAVVGSFMTQTLARPHVEVDVAVEMPASIFDDKDRLNHRYAHIRAFYLAVLADGLAKQAEHFTDLRFAQLQGNPLRPILECKPNISAEEEKSHTFTIRILPCISSECFKLSKLAPSRNNVRRAKNGVLLCGAAVSETEPEVATPHYNQSILQDVFYREHLESVAVFATGKNSTAFIDAVLMLKTWLRQRQMDKHHEGAFTGFHATMLLVHILQSHQLTREASSYQMFRKVLAVLADSQWDVQPLVMNRLPGSVAPAPEEDASAFQRSFDVVFLDPTQHINFLSDMTRAAYYDLRMEARAGLRLLDSEDSDGFDALFMARIEPEHKYDMLVRVSLHQAMVQSYPSQLLDWAGRWSVVGVRMVLAALTKGLADRAKLVAPLSMISSSWLCSQPPPDVQSSSRDVAKAFGILLDPQVAERTLDMGPDAEDKEASLAFRSFWGERAQVRRFQDSSIRESVLWECLPEQQPHIVKWIALHVLNRHCKLPATSVLVQRQWLDSVLCLPQQKDDQGSLQCREILKHFESLAHQLRRVKLPLGIHSFQGIDPVFRYAAVFPTAQPGAYAPVHQVMLRLEASSRWPDSAEALEHVKVAFFIRMARDLAGVAGISHVRIVAPAALKLKFRGVFFKIDLFVSQSLQLLRKEIKAVETERLKVTAQDAIDQLHERKAAAQSALAAMEYRYLVLPKVTGMLHSIHTATPSFGPAARLAKRWVAGHLLTPFVTEEAVELLVASAYGGPQPFTLPGSAHVGFLRFLRLLATHDFDAEPVIVDPHVEMSHGDLAEIRRLFREERATYPAIFIGTPHSGVQTPWTSSGPSRQILLRMVALARSTLSLAQPLLAVADGSVSVEQLATADIFALFRPALEDYDVVIKLKSSANPRRFQQLDNKLTSMSAKAASAKRKKNAPNTEEEIPDLAGYDPTADYVAELQREYGHLALFFYDGFGGDKIGAVFIPQARALADGHISEFADRAVNSSGKLELNASGIITTWAAMGEGLVDQIIVQRL